MNKIPSYLFSTTRQWNPGDEFILLGLINLIQYASPKEFNKIIFNRNPDVRSYFHSINPLMNIVDIPKFLYPMQAFVKIGFFDNSLKDNTNPEFIDKVFFAGTPEWCGERLKPLYHLIKKKRIPTYFIGIGKNRNFSYERLSNLEKDVLSKAKLITVRDMDLYKDLPKEIQHFFLPCPALFSSNKVKKIKAVKKVGLNFSTMFSVRNNKIPKKTYKFIIQLYHNLPERYNNLNFELICHYIDEVPDAYKKFGNTFPINYSYDSKDYLEIYKKFDLIITTRVHGSGIASSLGIPSIYIPHDIRVSTAEGFEPYIYRHSEYDIKSFYDLFEKTLKEASSKNYEIINHKFKIKGRYKELLSNSGI